MHVCIIAKAEILILNNATLSMLFSIQDLTFSPTEKTKNNNCRRHYLPSESH